MEKQIEKIRYLIAQGKIDMAITKLQRLSSQIPDIELRNKVIYRLAVYNKDQAVLLENNPKASQLELINSILQVLDELEGIPPKKSIFSFFLKFGSFEFRIALTLAFLVITAGIYFRTKPYPSRSLEDTTPFYPATYEQKPLRSLSKDTISTISTKKDSTK